MRRSLTPLIVCAGLAAGCVADGESRPPDQSSSAVIVTTTTTTGEPTDSSVATSTSASPPASQVDPGTTDGTGADGTETPSTVSPIEAVGPATTEPRAAEPVVGEPVVATEEVGRFDQPVDLAVRRDDDAFYVVEQPGRVVRFDGSDSTTILDITDRVSTRTEQGLLGLAFSPDGDRAYIDFTDADGNTVIAEYPVAADGALDAGAERIVLTVDQPYSNHNAGDLAFGPDGMLYITLGDGGSGGDPERRADDPTSLLGSILRIDPTPSGEAPYTIPADNPFADGVDGAPEVWSYGLRNPWKIAFDPITDELWIPDVGQNEFEEVNVVAPVDGAPAGRGVNFGWSAFEGTERFNNDVSDPGDTTLPVLTYRQGDDGCSVSGGAPYRGVAIADLEPAFVYSDFCSGKLWALDLAGGRNLLLLDDLDSVAAVRVGPDGELYVLERSGSLLRLIPG